MITAGAHPDWSTISQRIACPLCDYELRGLVEPRCPECGYQFDWDVILDPAKQRHPYLFEHYPKSNIWSFWRTKFAAMAPWKFWRTLKPTHEIAQHRLVIYWLLCASVIAVVIPGAFVSTWYELAQRVQLQRAMVFQSIARAGPAQTQMLVQRYGSIQKAVDKFYPPIFSPAVIQKAWQNYWGRNGANWRTIIPVATFLVWPWALNWTLMIFQTTMRRAKIKPIHVRRCVLYSCDNSILIGLLIVLLTPILTVSSRTNSVFYAQLQCILIAGIVIGSITALKLGFAYRKYLQFPWAWVTVIVAEIVVMLASVTFVTAMY